MVTGTGSNRSKNVVTLDDTDEEEPTQQPASRSAANKRRRTIVDDDEDEVEFVSQTLAGNSNRLVMFMYLSYKNTALRHSALDCKILYLSITRKMWICRLHSNNNIDFFIMFILTFIYAPLHLDRHVLAVLQVGL